jgi:hypothetical protein
MDTDEEPSGVSLSSKTETDHVGGGAICIVVVIIKPDTDLLLFIISYILLPYLLAIKGNHLRWCRATEGVRE